MWDKFRKDTSIDEIVVGTIIVTAVTARAKIEV
jgi:hypothetical protein